MNTQFLQITKNDMVNLSAVDLVEYRVGTDMKPTLQIHCNIGGEKVSYFADLDKYADENSHPADLVRERTLTV